MNWATNTYGSQVVSLSSELPGCEGRNILEEDLSKIWLSDEGLPQWLCISLDGIPDKAEVEIRTIGWHCWHAYSTNPREVRLHVSKDGTKFRLWDTFIGECQKGTQLFCCAPISASLYPFIALEIVSTFGSSQTYLNRVFFFADEVANSFLSYESDNSDGLDDRLPPITLTDSISIGKSTLSDHHTDPARATVDSTRVSRSVESVRFLGEAWGPQQQSDRPQEPEKHMDSRLDVLEERLAAIANMLSLKNLKEPASDGSLEGQRLPSRNTVLHSSKEADNHMDELTSKQVRLESHLKQVRQGNADFDHQWSRDTNTTASMRRSITKSPKQCDEAALLAMKSSMHTPDARELVPVPAMDNEDFSGLISELHSRILLRTIREAQLNLLKQKRNKEHR